MTGTIVEMGVGLDDFALASTLSAVENLRCEVERVVACNQDTVMPFVWLEGPSAALAGIESTLAADETVEEATCIASLEGERLYQMTWSTRTDLLLDLLLEADGTILSARATGKGWSLRLLFPTREASARAHDRCRENNVQCEIHTVYNISEGRQSRFRLTDEQRDALIKAFQSGYYEIPRERDLEELAAEFGISHQALSERLRRAHGSLVENAVMKNHRT